MNDTISQPRTALSTDIESSVIERYAAAAEQLEPALCCATNSYDPQWLEKIPEEILAKDYGCGDPTRYVSEGETVVDLGSGGGKICYILAQKVGASGRVIGVDFNDAMLQLARKYQEEMATKLGYHNVEFVKAKIQDMELDLDRVGLRLNDHPIRSMSDLTEFNAFSSQMRNNSPAVAPNSIDVVVSNCVLNLVKSEEKRQLFAEIFRVLRRGGRAVISDIVCDEEPTEAVKNDPDLWSGCIAGAFTESGMLGMFQDAGFHGIEILERGEEPWQTIDGVEYRSMTVRAFKGKQGPCLERNQAVIYRGPWSSVRDDDGHLFQRGERMALCDKTFNLLTDPAGPYHTEIIAVLPHTEIPLDEAAGFNCCAAQLRDPRQTKGEDYHETIASQDADSCGPEGCC